MGGGAGGSSSQSWSNPVLYNWQNLLTPWQQQYQPLETELLFDTARAGGMTGQQERSLWGQAKQQVETGANQAGLGFARQLASSGISPNSPAAAGGWSGIGSSKVQALGQAASEFIKTKLGQSNTAINQLLTALFTPAPAAVGQSTYSTSRMTGSA